jgi:hypothetical protein
MGKTNTLLRITLLVNGIVDVVCAFILLVLPLLHKPLLGYQVFDIQGAFMAGGWGVATLALAVGRIWGSSRPTHHPILLIMGVFEGTTLAIFSLLHLVFVHVPFLQILLPLGVGVVFGSLYWMCLLKKS